MFGKASPATTEAQEIISEPTDASYQTVDADDKINSLIEKLKEQKEISLAVATDEAENFYFNITGLAFSFSVNEAFFVPIKDKGRLQNFAEVFSSERISKTGHNIKQSILSLKKFGIEMRGQLFDTMLAHYLIEPEASHDLGILCNQYLNSQLIANNTDEAKNNSEQAERKMQLKNH